MTVANVVTILGVVLGSGAFTIGNQTGADRTWFAVDCTFQLADLPA